MTELKDPLRLVESDDAPVELRRWLQQAEGHRLSGAQAAQLLRFVEDRAADPGPAADPVSPLVESHAVLSRLPGKVLAMSAVVATAVLGGAVVMYRSSSSPLNQQAQPLTHLSASLSALRFAVNVEPPRPSAWSPRTGADQVASKSASTTREPPQSDADKDEYTLLRAARGALAREPALALRLADQHARQFASGMLAQEREAIAVDALVRLGNIGPAKLRAQRFLRSYPHSPYTKRIENAIQP